MMRETSQDYVPPNYVIDENGISDIIGDLKGIWKYGALDNFVENDNKKTPEDYIIVLIKMWDYLDKLTKATVESVIVELEGMIMKSQDPCEKALRTNLEQYLSCRIEQEMEAE